MDEFVNGLRAKRAEVEMERVAALKDAETAAFQVEHLEREVRGAKASKTSAEERALKAMERLEALDRTGLAFGVDLAAVEPVAALAELPDADLPEASEVPTASVAELVREHLSLRRGRNFTAREMAEALFRRFGKVSGWRKVEDVLPAVKTALRGASVNGVAVRSESTRGTVFQWAPGGHRSEP